MPPKRKRDNREERLTTFEISEMTMEDFKQISGDVFKCADCSYCLGQSSFGKDRYTEKGKKINKGCSALCTYILHFLSEHTRFVDTPKDSPEEESQPVEEGLYSQTKEFMRKRGYDRCYMCGSNLKEESPFD